MTRRPEVQIVGGVGCGPTPEEAAVVIAALEQFVRDHASAAPAPVPRPSAWRAAGLREGVDRGGASGLDPPAWT